MTKKIIALSIVMVMVLSFAACGDDNTGSKATSTAANTESTVSAVVTSSDVASVESKTESKTDKKKDNKTDKKTPTSKKTNTTSRKSGGLIGNEKFKPKLDFGGGGNTKTDTKSRGKSGMKAAVNVNVKKGDSLLNTRAGELKGKTLKLAITQGSNFEGSAFSRMIAAFETTYGCKVKTSMLDFGSYNSLLAKAKASGSDNMYDIALPHGSQFPACAIDKLYEDMSPYIRSGDIMNSNNPAAGGIDLNKTSYYAYKGGIYALCDYNSCNPDILYYNKAQMAEAGYSGSKDLRKLEESGKLTWNYIVNMGKKLTDKGSGIYFMTPVFCGRGTLLAFGAPTVTVNNGVYKENLSSEGYVAGLKFMRSLFVGNTAIAAPRDASYSVCERLVKGTSYLWREETSKYGQDLVAAVKTSSAFKRKKSNIGICKQPLGSTNKEKAYPCGWLNGIACGYGKNPIACLAFANFESQYKDTVKYETDFPEEDQKYIDKIFSGPVCCDIGVFSSSDDSTLNITQNVIIPKVVAGEDISKLVASYKDKMTACIEYQLKGSKK